MTETLYRKSWQPLAEADRSKGQVICRRFMGEIVSTCSVIWRKGHWCYVESLKPVSLPEKQEFLCLEPVEVETGDFPKVI